MGLDGKGLWPEICAFLGLILITVGVTALYSWPTALVAVGSVLFVLGVWSAIR